MRVLEFFLSLYVVSGRASLVPALEDLVEMVYETPIGNLRGNMDISRGNRSFYQFRSIPYAKPPVGARRFLNPVTFGKWPGVLDATKFGPLCIQKNYLLPGTPVDGQEDCLYLNVFTPNLSDDLGKLLPVLFIIHGGGFFSGASETLGPKYLMDHDVILVTFNYRVGPFGFFSTGDKAASGNWGLKDQVAALKWVQEHILYFGGDRDLVTIIGQSAGAASVHYHLLTQSSNGLFHRAISQSGNALSLWAQPYPQPLVLATAQAAVVGCPTEFGTSQIVDCLREKTAEEIVNSGDLFKFWDVDPLNVYTPVIEDAKSHKPYLTENPYDIIRNKNFSYIPWLLGSVRNEAGIRTSSLFANQSLVNYINQNFDELTPKLLEIEYSIEPSGIPGAFAKIKNHYFGNDRSLLDIDEIKFNEMYTDRGFTYSLHQAINLHTRSGHSNMYLYFFDYKGEDSYCTLLSGGVKDNINGACHCDDLLLLHEPTLFPFSYIDSQHPDYAASKFLVDTFVQFSIFGDPSVQFSWPKVAVEFEKNYPISGHIHYFNITKETMQPQSQLKEVIKSNATNGGSTMHEIDISSSHIKVTNEYKFLENRMKFWESLNLAENVKYLAPLYNKIITK